MMYNSPYFNPPYSNRNKNRYNYGNTYHSINRYNLGNTYSDNYNGNCYYTPSFFNKIPKKNNLNFEKVLNLQENEPQKKILKENTQPEIFEIFGLKLYFDDLLLICLIFFLYSEGVKDYYLFISLVLLLLS